MGSPASVRFPGVQTAHAAESFDADARKTGIAGISGRSVTFRDAEQRFPESGAVSRWVSKFAHPVKSEMARQNYAGRESPGMPNRSNLSELVGRAAAITARRAKIKRLIEIAVLA